MLFTFRVKLRIGYGYELRVGNGFAALAGRNHQERYPLVRTYRDKGIDNIVDKGKNAAMKKAVKTRILSFLMILTFLGNVFLPYFAVYNVQQAQAYEQSGSSSLFGEKILICTVGGFKWVTWNELKQEFELAENVPLEPSQQHYECPTCYVSAHATKHFLPATNIVFSHTLPEQQQTHRDFVETNNKSRFASCKYQSRAPPHIA